MCVLHVSIAAISMPSQLFLLVTEYRAGIVAIVATPSGAGLIYRCAICFFFKGTQSLSAAVTTASGTGKFIGEIRLVLYSAVISFVVDPFLRTGILLWFAATITRTRDCKFIRSGYQKFG